MKRLIRIMISFGALAIIAGCQHRTEEEIQEFHYLLDEFADLKVMRYKVPGWEDLTLQQKEYAYYLAEAAKYGRDILWDQNGDYNIKIRHVVENILNNFEGTRETVEFQQFETYAKRLFFSNGRFHHYAEDLFIPECSSYYFESLMEAVGDGDKCSRLIPIIYGRDGNLQRRSTSTDGDIVQLSAVNFYDGVTRQEVEDYYASIAVPDDPTPISYGLNTKVVKENGKVVEKPWKVDGIYSRPLRRICEMLEKAAAVAENDTQKRALGLLIEYYRTGDLRKWDEFNVEWVKDTEGTVDFINGFVEDYNDPLGRKGAWEGYVNIKDKAASERTEILCSNAQWFEDNAPIDPRFKKKEVKGITAKVVNAVCLAGDSYPSTPIGINLPNADWIRKDHGSKSVTIANITHAYDFAAEESPASALKEFAYDEAEVELYKKYGSYADEIHTDLHECLGHGSGQLLPGVSTTALGEYSSALEEARADLFGLYYTADPKMVELGIMPDPEAYKAEYSAYIRNGLFVQFNRVELGRPNTEAHMQNRKLIAEWCYEKGAKDNVIEKKVRDGKTYFVVNDFEALRGLFAELLAEIQRIKSEGDYQAGKKLIETYAVNIDPELHKEVKIRYNALNLKPYGGFINPEIVPVYKGKNIVDYEIVYKDNYLEQMLEYGRKYATLEL
ncbi:MAG: dihydrofolate reductase [Bacteroidales bacterium]|nr:dihydrofolate reductase [Bacteroidales bacterium]MBP5795462.1 dihydrofolate reductase [Bacteroidales bacterium]